MDVKGMRAQLLTLLLIIPLLATFGAAQTGPPSDPFGWNLTIIDSNDGPHYDLSVDGEVTVEFFIENTGLTNIQVAIEYETPFNASSDGPTSESIGAGENETFTVKLTGVDVRTNAAGLAASLKIEATLEMRAGTPIGSGDSRSDEVDIRIPRIYLLMVGDPTVALEFNSGTVMDFNLEVTNHGNSDDRIGDVEIEDDCPLLDVSVDEASDLEKVLKPQMDQNPGTAKLGFILDISAAHPPRACDIDISISSHGSKAENTLVWVETTVRIEIIGGDSSEEIVDDSPKDPTIVTKTNVPAPGIFYLFLSSLLAFSVASNRKSHP